jgi:hypothetical protein
LLLTDVITAAEHRTLLGMWKTNGTTPSVPQVRLELSPGNSTTSGWPCSLEKRVGGKVSKKACIKAG